MFRHLAVTAALALSSGAATAMDVTVAADRACRGGQVARYAFTFADPAGVDYAAVKVNAATAYPAVPIDRLAVLWIAPGRHENRAYQWRYEDEGTLSTRVVVPVEIVPRGGPILVETFTKDGAGALAERAFTLAPRCR